VRGRFAASSLLALAIPAALAVGLAPSPVLAQDCSPPTALDFRVEGKIVRSVTGFTQGLEVRDGRLYESTGRIGGTTRLNVISLDGVVKTLVDRGTAVFGEGLTILNDEVFQLTWQEQQVFAYDLAGKQKRTMRNPRDGWGLSNDGKRLLFTDGGSSIYFADPATFAIGGSLRVKSHNGSEIRGLNELELVRGKLYANIFTTRFVVRVDMASGCVDGVADLGVLWAAMTAAERAKVDAGPENVLNGIAYDDKSGLFYLTGKLWPVIFVGRFSERAPQR
jgi:glutamine cyclotransferase